MPSFAFARTFIFKASYFVLFCFGRVEGGGVCRFKVRVSQQGIITCKVSLSLIHIGPFFFAITLQRRAADTPRGLVTVSGINTIYHTMCLYDIDTNIDTIVPV